MSLLIKNGRVIDPASGRDGIYDVLVEDGIIADVKENIPPEGRQVIDASGCFVMPGLVDLHVHFREPGFEYKETIETGSKAAARGGFTQVCTMPNLKPVPDSLKNLQPQLEKIKENSKISVYPLGSISKEQKGKELACFEELAPFAYQ